jgi:tetratricopeptide (TPR) repeat protein
MPKGKYITRAERLAMADGADASAASTLGWIVNRMDMPARSVPLLEHAIKQATKDDLIEKTSFTLFESYLDLKDWRQAEAIFPVAERRLTPSEDPSWLGRIATIAAEKGDTADAMRLFRRVINLRLTNRRIVEDLSELGLKKEIRVYYATVRKRLPTAKLDHVFD